MLAKFFASATLLSTAIEAVHINQLENMMSNAVLKSMKKAGDTHTCSSTADRNKAPLEDFYGILNGT